MNAIFRSDVLLSKLPLKRTVMDLLVSIIVYIVSVITFYIYCLILFNIDKIDIKFDFLCKQKLIEKNIKIEKTTSRPHLKNIFCLKIFFFFLLFYTTYTQ